MIGAVWLARGNEWEQWIPPYYDTWWEVANGAYFLDHPSFPNCAKAQWCTQYVDVILHYPRHMVADTLFGDNTPPAGQQLYERLRFEWRGKMRGAYPLLEEMT